MRTITHNPIDMVAAAAVVLILSVACGPVGPALAGVGMGTSGTVTIDTEPPVVSVDQFPEYTIFQGGDLITFHWQTGDDHPATGPEGFQALVRIEGEAHAPFSFYPDIDDYTWNWTAVEASSANVHLEVVVKDAFGNTTIGVSNDFTLLSSVTGVPSVLRDLDFANPAPNPFNPATRLSFHLPEAGKVDLTVFDARGHRIRSLLSGNQDEGSFETIWDGRNDQGQAQAGGLYLFVLEFHGSNGSRRLTQKAVLVP